MSKSPFYIFSEFISPMMCEDIVDLCDFSVPDTDKDGNNIKTTKKSESSEDVIFAKLHNVVPDIEKYYGLTYRGTERISFEWFTPGSIGKPRAENSDFISGKWARTRPCDLTCVLFLSDFQNHSNFDSDYEVYGGKLEFPQHQFSFNPQRGTLVVFPSDPHFINATSIVYAGQLVQARINITGTTPYFYNASNFPGNFTSWF